MKKDYLFSYTSYNSSDDLSEEDRQLVKEARLAVDKSYAPYSNFKVGAAALLKSGEIVSGANQENASYPAGICAERVVLATVSSLYTNAVITKMAISFFNVNGNSNYPITPCGFCRQALLETIHHTGQSMQLILCGMEGEVWIIEDARQLLPLSFTGNDLKRK
jgi:cytidine deaminase